MAKLFTFLIKKMFFKQICITLFDNLNQSHIKKLLINQQKKAFILKLYHNNQFSKVLKMYIN